MEGAGLAESLDTKPSESKRIAHLGLGELSRMDNEWAPCVDQYARTVVLYDGMSDVDQEHECLQRKAKQNVWLPVRPSLKPKCIDRVCRYSILIKYRWQNLSTRSPTGVLI
jgi:hypothetical protein